MLLSGAFKYAVKNNYMDHNICLDIKLEKKRDKKQKDIISFEDEIILCSYIKDKTFSRLLICTGLRMSKLAGIRSCDVDLAKKQIILNEQLKWSKRNGKYGYHRDTPKSKKSIRRIPLNESALYCLIEQIDAIK